MKEPNEIERMSDRCAVLCLDQMKSVLEAAGNVPDPQISKLEHARLEAALRHRLSLEFEKILVSPLMLPDALKTALALVVYFEADRDRAEFLHIMRTFHPELTAKRL